MARLVLIKLARSRGMSWLGGYQVTENECIRAFGV